jgi:hypothetical protein
LGLLNLSILRSDKKTRTRKTRSEYCRRRWTRRGVTVAQVLDLSLAHGGAIESKNNKAENAERIRSVVNLLSFTFKLATAYFECAVLLVCSLTHLNQPS